MLSHVASRDGAKDAGQKITHIASGTLAWRMAATMPASFSPTSIPQSVGTLGLIFYDPEHIHIIASPDALFTVQG